MQKRLGPRNHETSTEHSQEYRENVIKLEAHFFSEFQGVRSGELWGALGSSGELWGALGRSGELWGRLGSTGEPASQGTTHHLRSPRTKKRLRKRVLSTNKRLRKRAPKVPRTITAAQRRFRGSNKKQKSFTNHI